MKYPMELVWIKDYDVQLISIQAIKLKSNLQRAKLGPECSLSIFVINSVFIIFYSCFYTFRFWVELGAELKHKEQLFLHMKMYITVSSVCDEGTWTDIWEEVSIPI